eukprot:2966394-Rhodomonas_salina.1
MLALNIRVTFRSCGKQVALDVSGMSRTTSRDRRSPRTAPSDLHAPLRLSRVTQAASSNPPGFSESLSRVQPPSFTGSARDSPIACRSNLLDVSPFLSPPPRLRVPGSRPDHGKPSSPPLPGRTPLT